jgi:hypothetical protein
MRLCIHMFARIMLFQAIPAGNVPCDDKEPNSETTNIYLILPRGV